MPKSEKVRVKMTGTTVWTIRPGDEVNIDEKMAKRWERGQLAVILNKPEELAEPTLSEMRKICEANGLAIRGTKAEVKARILEAGLELKLPEENLVWSEINSKQETLPEEETHIYEPESD